jgi:hypothetical protein
MSNFHVLEEIKMRLTEIFFKGRTFLDGKERNNKRPTRIYRHKIPHITTPKPTAIFQVPFNPDRISRNFTLIFESYALKLASSAILSKTS